MADQTTSQNRRPTRVGNLAGMVGEALAVRSPILGQLRESASALVSKPEKGETRLGNALSAVKQSAVNNSTILRQFAMLKDALLSAVQKDDYGKATEKTPKTQEDQKTKGDETKRDSTAIIEYLENKENPYYVMMKSDNNYLEQMVQLLKQQSETMKETLQITKEAGERSRTQKDLESVSRSDAARARAARQPRDDMGRFISQPEGQADSESGLIDTIDDVLDITRGLRGRVAAAVATLTAVGTRFRRSLMSGVSRLGGAVRGAASRIRPLARGFASSVGSLIDDAGRATRSVLPSVGRIASRGLGLAVRAVGSTAFGAAMGILNPSDLGDGTPEGTIRRNYADELREMGFDPETGEAESPEAEAQARAFIDEKIRTGEFVPERGLPPEQQYDPETGEPVSDEARENIERIRREREEREEQARRMRTTREPPDLTPPAYTPLPPPTIQPGSSAEIQEYLDSIAPPPAPPPIIGSTPMTRMQDYLSFMGNAVQPRPAASQQTAAPVIVNNQGGPTSVNNGGNVTNIITGGSSLSLPQLAYNLPSSLS